MSHSGLDQPEPGFAATEREAWRAEVDHLHEIIGQLAGEIVRSRAIDHSQRNCCEWHILNGKPWLPTPTGVIYANKLDPAHDVGDSD